MYNVEPKTSPVNNDCGATCLQMMLLYYGTDVQLKDLTNECNTTIAGCSALDLVNAGKAHGLDMKAYKMDAEQLFRQDRPAIIWWKYNHWCIFCGIDEYDNAVICNPDRGRYGMKKSTFKCIYAGVSLFNGQPSDVADYATIPERLSDAEYVADMAYVNSELALAMMDMEV